MFTNVTNFPNGWFLAVGTHTDGRRVELLTGKPIDQWQKPVPYSSVFPNHNWRRYWVQLVSPRSAVFHADLGRYLCRNPPVINNPANSLREIEILYIGYEFTKTFRKREQKPRKLLHYSCPSLPT
jgi:hypothetical protein